MPTYAGHSWVDDDPTKPLSAARMGDIDTALTQAYVLVTALQSRIITPVPISYAATITPDASTGSVFYCVATGNVTLNDPTNGADGQHVTVAIQASGAPRTITFSDGSSVAVASGKWWAGRLLRLATPNVWIITDGV